MNEHERRTNTEIRKEKKEDRRTKNQQEEIRPKKE